MQLMKSIIFSGIQPTAQAPHLGNYLGALRQWVNFQSSYQSYFCVVDLHALTVPQKKEEFTEAIYASYALLLAIGIDTKLSNLFVQSHVPEHTELAWLLNCFTSIGQLSRMTQYKEKSEQQKQFVSAGLYDYPVLMAADILLYDTDKVPVGEDQVQHIELARDVATRFNHLYGDTFKLPQPMLIKETARIMSLQQPDKKMSKSDPNVNAAIFLLDSPDLVQKKISTAVTDSQTEIKFDPTRKGLYNLLSIYKALKPAQELEIEAHFQGKGYQELKTELVELINEFVKPIQTKYQQLIADKPQLKKLMKEQAEIVREKAAVKVKQVKQAIGLIA